MSEDPRYPIGKFEQSKFIPPAERAASMGVIRDLPRRMLDAVDGLTESQLDTPYREGGWTLRQTVHHVADSHINSLCRFKLALTEDEAPTIRPYYEDRWADLADSSMPVDVSLKIIEGVHSRWTALLESMTEDDFRREFIHPETGSWTLENVLALYAWHSRHHTAHITSTRERNGW
ncbi:MAG TPA: bacillithiol transferase BstA [Pyrinomonadaceae bacterium]|nr:bacillithiol transferase BstA [Pyrinomonadaceae bacterium]